MGALVVRTLKPLGGSAILGAAEILNLLKKDLRVVDAIPVGVDAVVLALVAGVSSSDSRVLLNEHFTVTCTVSKG